jgi:nucleoside-diphosphate-sugar epimerase
MDFVYIEDVARSNVLALASDVKDEVFNIASGTVTSLNELAAALLKVMGSNLKPEYGPERKVNPASRRLADISKARRLLGFEPTVDLEEGLVRSGGLRAGIRHVCWRSLCLRRIELHDRASSGVAGGGSARRR